MPAGQALDGGGEFVLVALLEGDARIDDLTPAAVGEEYRLAGGQDVFEHADDDVVVDVGGGARTIVTVEVAVELDDRRGDFRGQALFVSGGLAGRQHCLPISRLCVRDVKDRSRGDFPHA